MKANLDVNVSLAAFPGLYHQAAAEAAAFGVAQGLLSEPLFGDLSMDHVQLVPQNFGLLDEAAAAELMSAYPASQFRLHANVQVVRGRVFADLSTFKNDAEWFRQAGRISRQLGAPAYSAHSGYRVSATMPEMLENARRCSELFGCPVAVEGQYPDKSNSMLVSDWDEYRSLFESGVPYALDLSHLNIVAHKSQRIEAALVQEMLSCERCIEVHVSDNDGSGDWHQVCDQPVWWHPYLRFIHPGAVVFSEGNHRRKRPNWRRVSTDPGWLSTFLKAANKTIK